MGAKHHYQALPRKRLPKKNPNPPHKCGIIPRTRRPMVPQQLSGVRRESVPYTALKMAIHNESHNISIASINTQGLKSNIDYVFNDIIKNNDIIFLCEHWLSTAEKHIVTNDVKTHKLYFTSTEKQAAGRPYGGNCFLIENVINNTGIKVIHEDAHILAFNSPSSISL